MDVAGRPYEAGRFAADFPFNVECSGRNAVVHRQPPQQIRSGADLGLAHSPYPVAAAHRRDDAARPARIGRSRQSNSPPLESNEFKSIGPVHSIHISIDSEGLIQVVSFEIESTGLDSNPFELIRMIRMNFVEFKSVFYENSEGLGIELIGLNFDAFQPD